MTINIENVENAFEILSTLLFWVFIALENFISLCDLFRVLSLADTEFSVIEVFEPV